MVHYREEENSRPPKSKKEDTQHGKPGINNQPGEVDQHQFEGGEVVLSGEADVTKSAFERWSLKLVNKAPSTRKVYLKHVKELLESCGHKPANRINDTDVQRYLNSLNGWSSKSRALAAIKGFLKEAGRTVRDVELGPKKERRPIQPILDEDFEKMLIAAKCLRDKAILLVLKDTGGRATAICEARPEDFKGDHLILQGDTAKNNITSMAPLTKQTQETMTKYLEQERPEKRLFNLTRSGLWQMISKLAKQVGIRYPVYPHLFRHTRALEYRRANVQPDTVMNAMGWKDTSQYDRRYGKRTATETLEEARVVIERQRKKIDPSHTEKVIERLATLLSDGKIDLQTYQATIVALTKKDRKQDQIDVPGYY